MSVPEGWPPAPEPLPSPVVDSHCHLDLAKDGDPLPVELALRLATNVGVTRVVQVGVDVDSSTRSVELVERYPNVVAAVALHPNEAPGLARRGELDSALDAIDRLAEHPRVRAIGETGLDYFRTGHDGRPEQERSFRRHIEMAKHHGKTLVIHDREAHLDILRVLDDQGAPKRVVMHCFSGDEPFARACVDRGYALSFAGTVTFKNANALRAAAAVTPADRLLVETDAPYLAPTPHRGQPNASYLMPLTVQLLATVRNESLDTTCAALDESSERFFGTW